LAVEIEDDEGSLVPASTEASPTGSTGPTGS